MFIKKGRYVLTWWYLSYYYVYEMFSSNFHKRNRPFENHKQKKNQCSFYTTVFFKSFYTKEKGNTSNDIGKVSTVI